MRFATERRTFLLARWEDTMAALTDAGIDAALARGEAARLSEPRAAAGGSAACSSNSPTAAPSPSRRVWRGLENATEDHLAGTEVLGAGSGPHWEAPDTDLSVSGLLAGPFGTKARMAWRGGRATSQAKAAAARANGAEGGRSRKVGLKHRSARPGTVSDAGVAGRCIRAPDGRHPPDRAGLG